MRREVVEIGTQRQDARAILPAGKRRRRWRLVLACMLVPVVVLSVFGWTARVTAPATVDDPVRVFVLREALHTGLVFPPDPAAGADGDRFVEFGFGDWSWYALGHDDWYHVFATVLVPTQGALGRRRFDAKTEAELRSRAWWAQLAPVLVSRERAAALRRRLQTLFDAGRDLSVERRQLGFHFVPSSRSYWCVDNCNDEVARWLGELDCEVGWCPVRAAIEVVERRP